MKILEWVLSVVLKCWLCDLSLIKLMTSGHHSFFSINVKLGEVLSNEER